MRRRCVVNTLGQSRCFGHDSTYHPDDDCVRVHMVDTDQGTNMRNNLLVSAGLAACLTFTSCAAGPQQLQRSVDDWDHKMYVQNPLLDGVLWVVPVFPLLNFGAAIGDFFIGNAYFFWFHDVWDGKGTGFEHAKVEATDGTVSSLLNEGSSWLKVKK